VHPDALRVRAGSALYATGGTVHHVTGGFYHGSYDESNHDYNVAVLRVCIDFDIANFSIFQYMG